MMLSSTPPASVLATAGLRREEKTKAQTVEVQGTEWQMPQEEQMNCCRALENGNAFYGITSRWWTEPITQTLAPPIDL